jgi:hypothetical protein
MHIWSLWLFQSLPEQLIESDETIVAGKPSFGARCKAKWQRVTKLYACFFFSQQKPETACGPEPSYVNANLPTPVKSDATAGVVLYITPCRQCLGCYVRKSSI